MEEDEVKLIWPVSVMVGWSCPVTGSLIMNC